MKRPSLFSYVIGNAVSVLLLGGLTCYLGYEWWSGDTSAFFAIIFAIATASAANANERVSRYNRRKREWDAMEGRTARRSSFLTGRRMRLLLGIPAWLIGAYGALAFSNDPIGHVGAILFWLASAAGIIGSIVQWIRARPRRIKTTASKDVAVTLCVGRPTQSADLGYAYRALPNYCVDLLNRGAGSAALRQTAD